MTTRQANCKPLSKSSNNRSNVKNNNSKTPVSNSSAHQISTKVSFHSQIALLRYLPSLRKSLHKPHPSKHPILPHLRNKIPLPPSRSLKLAIISRIVVIKSSPHPISSKWTTSLPSSKQRAPRRISTCLVMCLPVYKNGTYQLNKLVEISGRCL